MLSKQKLYPNHSISLPQINIRGTVFVYMCKQVKNCVCVRGLCVCVCKRQRGCERTVCVCVYVRHTEKTPFLFVCACMRIYMCVCVFVCVWKRQSEWVHGYIWCVVCCLV